ncbi:ABC transporter ATP-binding protein [Marininema halotolerans]|uniref:ABC-2 type transport system ATP-binding protein n=1 Tax=Marininema halotolerans TaxID=1155944 RepID=A0A1I6U2K4_9BACL|nr:ABC transporter ATP-binding protein [Marininema halotolerans]SFS95690.1 ABC-2 type transport system ATP-binding protein [Marininema halotolerans]
MLTIQELSKKFDQNFVVNQFDLTIQPHEIVAIAGPNGAGKTTIINCLLGITSPTNGEIHLDDFPQHTKEFKKRMAYVPDELLLPDALTGIEYIQFVNRMYERESGKKTEDLIELFDMQDAFKKPIETYSHGMKKKTQLIAAFMLNSQIIVLDEPFRGLDVEAIIMTKRLMEKYTEKGGSILLATHDLLSAEAMCNRVAILSRGMKVAEGHANELKNQYDCKNLEEVFMKVSMLGERRERFEKIIDHF